MIEELKALSRYAAWLRKEATIANTLTSTVPKVVAGGLAVGAGVGKFKEYKAGFNPAVQAAQG